MIRQSTRWFREFIERQLDEAARTKMKRVYGVAKIFWGIFASGRVAIADPGPRDVCSEARLSSERNVGGMQPERSGHVNTLSRAERTRLGQRHVAVEKAERSA
jgi:hypothetical protein